MNEEAKSLKKKPELLILVQGMQETAQMAASLLERIYCAAGRLSGDVCPPETGPSDEEPTGTIKQSAYWLSRIRSNISEANAVIEELEGLI